MNDILREYVAEAETITEEIHKLQIKLQTIRQKIVDLKNRIREENNKKCVCQDKERQIRYGMILNDSAIYPHACRNVKFCPECGREIKRTMSGFSL